MNKTYDLKTFPNGLKLITVPMPGVASATVMVLVGAGSRFETKKINGLSHFLEHMAFKGTKKRPSALLISSEIDAIGGEFNAFTSKDHTGFYVKAAATHLDLMIDVLSDMLLGSLFKPEEIEREKGVIIEEINMYRDTPARHISDVYDELLFGNHPLGWKITGEPDNIRAITREDFLQYLKGLYKPNNVVLIVAGGIAGKEANITTLVKSYLGNWQKAPVLQWKKLQQTQTQPRVKLEYKDSEQAHIVIGVPAYPLDHPKQYALSVLSAILGGGMSSRLFIEVREQRGLAYYVHSNADYYLDVGSFTTQAGVDVARIDDAIRVILAQLWAVADGSADITPKELTKAKEYLKGRLTLELEDSRAVAGLYGTQQILKRNVKTPQEVISRTEAVTLSQVHAVARELFIKNHLNLAVVGPYKDQARFEKLLT